MIEEGFDVPKDEIVLAIKDQTHCSTFGASSLLRLDFKAPTSQLEYQGLANRVPFRILNETLYLQIPEEIIIAKILYGSDQDIEDVFGIISRNKDNLNYDRLKLLAKQESVTEVLYQLLSQAIIKI
ncbi:MAG: hypothetical protein ACTSYA_11060 [Candidatus Kariarchaeaceae archaeon]